MPSTGSRWSLTPSRSGSPVRLSLDDGETPIELIGGEDGAVLLTTRDGELHARILSSSMVVISDVLVERNWGGEVASTVRSDAMIQLAWTRRTMSEDGTLRTSASLP